MKWSDFKTTFSNKMGKVASYLKSLLPLRDYNQISKLFVTVFSRVHASLQPALSVRPSVRSSVRPSVRSSVGPSVSPSVTPVQEPRFSAVLGHDEILH